MGGNTTCLPPGGGTSEVALVPLFPSTVRRWLFAISRQSHFRREVYRHRPNATDDRPKATVFGKHIPGILAGHSGGAHILRARDGRLNYARVRLVGPVTVFLSRAHSLALPRNRINRPESIAFKRFTPADVCVRARERTWRRGVTVKTIVSRFNHLVTATANPTCTGPDKRRAQPFPRKTSANYANVIQPNRGRGW